MATRADVRRIALSLPEAEEAEGHFAFGIRIKDKLKGFAWVWMERIVPKKPRVANAGVLAIRVATLAERDLLISLEPKKFFTEPHYEGFPAVLVRLEEVSASDLRVLLDGAWHTQAPTKLKNAPRKTAKKTKGTAAKRTVVKRRKKD